MHETVKPFSVSAHPKDDGSIVEMGSNHIIRKTLIVAAFLMVVLLLASQLHAGSTRHFLLDDTDALADGELDGTAVNSDGTVTAGVETRRLELKDTALAYCIARTPDGSVFIGSGNQGKIYKLIGDNISVFAETGQLLVTTMATDDKGILYAGTLPNGIIFSIDKKGNLKEFAKPEETKHIWSLVFDKKRRVLFAATGPQGKVFSIDLKGKIDLYYDSDADHVLALALDNSGDLFAGTSGEALLLRLTGPGRAEVVHDFATKEVTAIDVYQGNIAVAANDFDKSASTSSRTVKDKSPTNDQSKPSSKTSKARKAPKPGKGQLWRIGSDGRAEQLFETDKGHLTAVQFADEGVIYAASGREGRIFRIRKEGTHAVWIDVDERQVLDMDLRHDSPVFVTGDTGAVYRVVGGKARKAIWTSGMLDAEFRSRWGKLTFRAKGRLSFQTRSGNTEKPDATWSDWSSPLTKPGPIRSPASRFLQIRARLDVDTDAMIYAVAAYYLPQNQRAKVYDIEIRPKTEKGSQAKNKSSKKTSKKKIPTYESLPKPTSLYDISWKTENPDNDALRFRLKYRAEGQKIWRQMLKETEILKVDKYTWDTSGIPDGFYRIQVDASDELANPKGFSEHFSIESEPVLIDNHPPHVERLQLKGKNLHGLAQDDMGPIAKLEYAVDGEDWILFFPADDIFDTNQEVFILALEDLPSGSHIIAVRATDSAGNTASSEITIP